MGREKTHKELEVTKVSEDAVREYAESIINTMREVLIVLDQDLRVITTSRAYYEFFKVKPEETVGQLIYDLGNKQWDIPGLRELLETILPEKAAFDNYEVEHDFAVIGRRTMLLNARQIQRASGKERVILLAMEDITDRKRLENLLAESEELFRRLYETASDGIVLLEKGEGKITRANPAIEKMLGYSNEESIGNKLQDIGVSLDMHDFQATMQELNRSGIINYNDIPVKTRSGQHIDTDIYLVDKTTLVQCNIRDITDRRQAEAELKESKALFEAVVENLPLMIFLKEATDLRFVVFNRAGEELLGYDRRDLIGKNNLDLFPPEQAAHFMAKDREVLDGEIDMLDIPEEPILTAKKGQRLLHTRKVCIRGSDGVTKFLLGISDDITERRQAEAKIKQQIDAMEASIDGIGILNEDQKYVYVNEAHARIYGYDAAEELIGQSWHILYEEDELQRFNRDIMPEFGRKGQWRGEATGKKKDGSAFFQEVSLTALDSGGLICVVRDTTDRKLAEERLKQTMEKLRKNLVGTIHAMSLTVEARDPYTAGHQERVSSLAWVIAQEMGLPNDTVDTIRMAGSIHDIGKISVPAEILSKPGKLTDIEFSLIKVHPQSGYDIIKDTELPHPIAEIVLQHHERLDGSGYPRGLKGEQILLESQIISVADVVEAMASHRPYRPARGIDSALEETEKSKGILYNAGVVDVCVKLFREKKFCFESVLK
ncbi:MAG: PAS domain S-box protein [Syntrophorhabdaceae bacterium]|nr:PAS domain S-box protein [Syntrophorhabdaceae bacterium]